MRKETHTLPKTQKVLWRFITAPEGVEKALRDNPGIDLPVYGDARLSSAKRLDIYANMYFFRILDSLKEDFPIVLKTVGAARFHNLITDYLIKHPSKYWSLRYVGKGLPSFLKKHSVLATWPFLSELAQFEWALLDVFDAANAPLLTREQLSRVAATNWDKMKLQTIPAFRILKSIWPVERMKESQGSKIVTPRKKKSHLIIWRQDFKVYYRLVDELEKALFTKMRRGAHFAEICAFVAETSGMDQALSTIHKLIKRWLNEGLITAL